MEYIVKKSTLPETGFVRLPHIIGDAKAQPPIPAIIPVSKSTWWAGVKSGRFSPADQTRAPDYCLASRGYSETDQRKPNIST